MSLGQTKISRVRVSNTKKDSSPLLPFLFSVMPRFTSFTSRLPSFSTSLRRFLSGLFWVVDSSPRKSLTSRGGSTVSTSDSYVWTTYVDIHLSWTVYPYMMFPFLTTHFGSVLQTTNLSHQTIVGLNQNENRHVLWYFRYFENPVRRRRTLQSRYFNQIMNWVP